MKTLLTTRSLYKIPAASNTEQKNKKEGDQSEKDSIK